MQNQFKFLCGLSVRPIFFLMAAFLLSGNLAGQTPGNSDCPTPANWANWEVEYLDAGKLVCSHQSDYELEDDFNGTHLNEHTKYKGAEIHDFWITYFEGASCGPHFFCEDQIYTGNTENVRVANGHLILTARSSPGTNCNGETRDFTSGMVKGQAGLYAFNYGRYTIRCNFPTTVNPLKFGQPAPLWPGFYMNHHEEVDMFENTGSTNSYNIGSHGSGGFSCSANVQGVNLVGDHTYEVEWTPFKTRFFFDQQQVGPTIYKYYNAITQAPLDIDCGGEIPEGYYKINPSFIHTKQGGEPRYFLPIIGLGILPDCWECGYNNSPSENPCGTNWRQNINYVADNLLPAEWSIDRVSINEVTYEYVKIRKNYCSDKLCPGNQYCFAIESKYLNGTINDPAPIYTPSSWQFSANVTPLAPTPPTQCVVYNGPLNGEAKIDVQANIPAGPNNTSFVLNQHITNSTQAPEIEWQFVCPHRFYIKTHGRCLTDLTIAVTHNNQSVPYTVVQNTRDLIEISVDEREGDLTVTYPSIGTCNGSTSSVTQHFVAPHNAPIVNVSFQTSICKTIICIDPNGGCIQSYDLGGLPYEVVSNNNHGICLEVPGLATGTITVNHINGTLVQPFHFEALLGGTFTVEGNTFPLQPSNVYASASSLVLLNLKTPEGASGLTGTIVSGSGSLTNNGNNKFTLVFPRGTSVTVRFCYSVCEQVFCFFRTFTNTGIGGFGLSPNPASDQIRITTPAVPMVQEAEGMERSQNTSANEPLRRVVAVVDLASKERIRKEVSVLAGEEFTVDISSLHPGMYFVQIYNSEGKVEQVIPFTKTEN